MRAIGLDIHINQGAEQAWTMLFDTHILYEHSPDILLNQGTLPS